MSDSAPHTLTSILAHAFDTHGTPHTPLQLDTNTVNQLARAAASLSPDHPDYARTHALQVLWAAQQGTWDQMRTLIPPLGKVDWGTTAGTTISWAGMRRLAVVAHEAGGLSVALQLYQRLLSWYESDAPAYAVDIIGTLNDIGHIHQRRQHYPQAEQAFAQALQQARQLVAASTDEAHLRLLATTLINVGTNAQDQQHYAAAREAYHEDYQISRQLASRDASDASDASDANLQSVSLAINNLAHLALLAGDIPQAKQWFDEDLDLAQQLYAQAPTVTSRSLLLKAQVNMGRMQQGMGDHGVAVTTYMEALKTGHQLIEERGNEQDRRTVAHIYSATATSHQQNGNMGAALESLGEALATRRTIAKRMPSLQAQRDITLTLAQMGSLYQQIRNFSAAKSALSEAISIRQQLPAAQLGPADMRDMVLMLSSLGRIHTQLEETTDAQAAAQQAYQLALQTDTAFRPEELEYLKTQAAV